MNKMKVLMTQVFSHTVGALMKRISQWDIQSDYKLSSEAQQTADFILFIDKFDNLNGNSKIGPAGKSLKSGVTSIADHEVLWEKAIVLNSIRFWNSMKNKYIKVPSVVNLVRTIQGFIYLKTKLLERMSYILPRALRRKFFAAMRSHGRRNTSPDIVHLL